MEKVHLKWMIYVMLLGAFIMLPTGCTFVDPYNVDDNDYSASESFEYEISIDGKTRFHIMGINGSITITGTENDTTILVTGERVVRSESVSDAEARLEDLKVDTSATNDEIIVRTDQPNETHGRTYEVTYNIILPFNFLIRADNVNGVVSIDSTQNDVTVNLTNGNIYVDHHIGKADLHLTNGNISITSQSNDVDVGITNGNVDADIQLEDQGQCNMGTGNGEIALNIPQNTSASFSAVVTNGQIWVSDLELQNLNVTPNATTGNLGDGSGAITLQTVNGSIHVDGY